MPPRLIVAVPLLVACAAAPPRTLPDAGELVDAGSFVPTRLTLVAVRDRLEDSFLTNHAIAADATRVYLAGFSGTVHVLGRDVDAGLPEIQAIPQDTAPAAAVAVDGARLWSVSSGGTLFRYALGETVTLEASRAVSAIGASDLVVHGGVPFVGVGQARVAVDATRVFVSALNEGEVVLALDPETLVPTRTYGAAFEAHVTVAYDRATGARIGSVPNPTDLHGNWASPALAAFDGLLSQVVPGCCGRGLALWDAETLAPRGEMFRSWLNAVTSRDGALVGGTELGEVVLLDVANDSALDVVALREATGHTGSEDIEIRAVWADAHDRLVFAASSWGNDSSRAPTLPSLFVFALE